MGGPKVNFWHRLGLAMLVRQLVRRFCCACRLNTELADVFPGHSNNHCHPGFSSRICKTVKVKVQIKFTLEQATALDGVGGQRHTPAALPPGQTRHPLYRRLSRFG
jgi:hypothetical protein